MFKGVPQGIIKKEMNHSSSSTTNGYTTRLETSTLIKKKHYNFQNYIIAQSRKVSDQNKQNKSDEVVVSHDPGYDKRIVFSDVNLVAEWIAYREKIHTDRDRLKLENPSRWEMHWQVVSAEYEALIGLVDSRTFAAAKKLALNIQLPFLD